MDFLILIISHYCVHSQHNHHHNYQTQPNLLIFKAKAHIQYLSGHLDLTHNLQVKLLSFVVSFFSLTIIPQITYFKIGDADRTKQELDKAKEEEARNKAKEKLSETKRRKNDGSEVEPKRRRSGSETVQYLREKSEREASIKEREFELEQRKQEEE